MNWELILSIFAIIISIFSLGFSYYHFKIKRKDDLFILRYSFYKRLSKAWLSTSDKNEPEMNIKDLIPIAEVGKFLFGEDIEKHILSLAEERANHDLFPDGDFSLPFQKYLDL